MKTTDQPRIFISYSHGGNGPAWKASLLRALHVFELHHLLDVWEDGKIRVSAYWDDDITQAMTSAQLAVVLLTAEALKSMYVIEREFPILSSRQTHDKLPIIPVICEPCDWKAHDWIRATQAPNASNPLSELTPTQIDRVFRAIATEIAETLSHVALAGLSSADAALQQTRVYLDRFPLTRGAGLHHEKLIGREQELALLDLAFAQSHTAIVSLVAWGGVGKTMLVQHWLQHLQRQGWFGGRRVYAWSFYSQGTTEDRQASEDMFLAHALDWFGVQCEPTLSPWEKGRLLANALARERTLLILDGIEPLQYPPGPMGGQLRAPGVQSLLKQLARKRSSAESEVPNPKSEINNSLCLVTTREPLTDLADFQRRPQTAWGSVLRVDLGNLTEEAGAALLHYAGAKRAGAAEIKPDDPELLAASREVDGHALTLNLLGRFLARAHADNILRRDLVKFEDADRIVQGGTTFKMLAAFENLFAGSEEFGARQLAVLRLLGLFDRPADAGCIAALRRPPVIVGLTDPLFHLNGGFLGWGRQIRMLSDDEWNTVTSFLTDFGLATVHADDGSGDRLLDCHPLIREHFASTLRRNSRSASRRAHQRLYKYLIAVSEPYPGTIDGLQPLYQAVAHGCMAGLHVEALSTVYSQRIQRSGRGAEPNFSMIRLGAYDANLSALACCYEEPWFRLAAGFSKPAQAWIHNHTGYQLRALGRLSECVEPLRLAHRLRQDQRDWANVTRVGVTLSEVAVARGEIPDAVKYGYLSLEYSHKTHDAFVSELAHGALAAALHQAGRRDEALAQFDEAETVLRARQPDQNYLYSTRGFQCCDTKLYEPEVAAWRVFLELSQHSTLVEMRDRCHNVEHRAVRTLNLHCSSHWASILDVSLDQLTLGRAFIYRSLLDRSRDWTAIAANHMIGTAVQSLRRASVIYHIPLGLLSNAWVHYMSGDADGARADLDEAWDIAERGPMRLHMADIHLHRARIFYREKHYPWKSPENDLAVAEKLINECGYHRRDEELADAKRAILGE